MPPKTRQTVVFPLAYNETFGLLSKFEVEYYKHITSYNKHITSYEYTSILQVTTL